MIPVPKPHWRPADPAFGRAMFKHAVGFLGWKNECIRAGVAIDSKLDRLVEVEPASDRRYARLVVKPCRDMTLRFALVDTFTPFEKVLTKKSRALYRLPVLRDVVRAEIRTRTRKRTVS